MLTISHNRCHHCNVCAFPAAQAKDLMHAMLTSRKEAEARAKQCDMWPALLPGSAAAAAAADAGAAAGGAAAGGCKEDVLLSIEAKLCSTSVSDNSGLLLTSLERS
jgi:hypothetical protein